MAAISWFICWESTWWVFLVNVTLDKVKAPQFITISSSSALGIAFSTFLSPDNYLHKCHSEQFGCLADNLTVSFSPISAGFPIDLTSLIRVFLFFFRQFPWIQVLLPDMLLQTLFRFIVSCNWTFTWYSYGI